MPEIFEKIRNTKDELEHEMKDKVRGYIMAALGFVVALAWNDAIKSLIEFLFPAQQGGIFLKFVYALVLTVAVIVASKYIFRGTKTSFL